MRYSGGVEPSEDLFQVASLGLVSALERYDPERGVPFAAFAGPTILGELRRHFRDRVWTLRVPRGLQESIRAVEGAITKLSHELEALPDGGRDRRAARDQRGRRAGGLRGQRGAADRVAGPADPRARLGARRRRARCRTRIGSEDPGYELVEDRAAIDAGTGRARRHRTRGAAPALRRGPDPVEDRRAGRATRRCTSRGSCAARSASCARPRSATSRPEFARASGAPDADRRAPRRRRCGSTRISSARRLERGIEGGDPHPVQQAPPAARPRAGRRGRRTSPRARRRRCGRCRRETRSGRWRRSRR